MVDRARADDLKYWLGFNLVQGIGPARLQRLLEAYPSVEAAWFAADGGVRRLGLDRRARDNWHNVRATVDLDAALARVQGRGITLLNWESPGYPRYLRELAQPPPLLYVDGQLEPADLRAVAVVGTRRLTSYGRQVTRDLVTGLVQHGVTIVSGLARGIDTIAHETALEQGGRTIAVLGSGLDQIYPPENRKLARRIAGEGCGALVTEYALGTRPEAKNFPPRNRVISGLALGVLVIEAGEQSGALITARFALEQDREVFAVPGPIHSPASIGPNRLLQQGAKLVTTVGDILEELQLDDRSVAAQAPLPLPESAEEALLLGHLGSEPRHVDELSRACGLPAGMLGSVLAMMELKGLVRAVGGMRYVARRHVALTN